MTRPRFSVVLSNPGFLLLWMGQLLSQLADRIFIYVLMILAYSLTRSNLGVSIPMLSFGIPSILFGSLAGVYADRLDRKGIMVISCILRGLLILLLVPLVNKSIASIFFVSFFIYTVAQFFAPAESSSIPELVEKKNLIIANSLFVLTWMGASMLGFGLGAPIVNWIGEQGTFVLSATFYLISSGLIFLVPLKYKISDAGAATGHVLKDLKNGFDYINENSIVGISLLKMFIATSALAVVSLLAISYAKEVLMIGERNFGYLVIAAGLGMFAGMTFLGRVSHIFKKSAILMASFIISGISLFFVAAVSDVKISLLLIFILGVCNILINSSLQTILQSVVPAGMRGRVFGAQNMLINSAFTFPLLIFGAIADIWGIRTAIAVLGATMIAGGFIGFSGKGFKTSS
jgi:predicted MFS family arabinose efflux permease